MRRFTRLLSMVSLGLGLNACWLFMNPPEIVPDQQTFSKQLTDADGDGFMTSPECDPTSPTPFCWWVPTIEEPGCVIVENPGDCVAVEWTQTITLDADGWMTYDTTQVCVDAEGNPIEEPQVEEGASMPPVMCWQIDEACWECSTSDGEIFEACVPPTQYCDSDDDCSGGEGCIWYPDAECPPGALCAPGFGSGVCGVVEPETYCNFDEECPAGYSCTPNENPPCKEEPCFFNEQYYEGVCTPSEEPQVDPCEAHSDPDSCNADASNLCGWVEDPSIVCVTEPCIQGSCHNIGCGDASNP